MDETLETIATYAAMALVLGGLLWFGLARDRRTGKAIHRFAERHGLQYDQGALWKGIRPSASGRYLGWKIFIGPVVIETYTKGIGPANREVQLEARLELPEGVEADPLRLHGFLQEGGGITGRSLMVHFFKTPFRPVAYEEIERAVARLVDAAKKTA